MKILMVASEAVPFAKTGGLADVAGTLPRFLRKLGHDVRLVLPAYRCIDKSAFRQQPGSLCVPMGPIGDLWAAVQEGVIPGSDVPTYLIEYNHYFDRDGLYNEKGGEGFLDNDNRFVFLSRAALQLCHKLNFTPDVIHANDWHTAAVPVLLDTIYRDDPLLRDTASILTIHNMDYQGRFYRGLIDVLGVGFEHFNMHDLEWNGMTNLLKGGLYHATLINAVSKRYAYEIRTPEFGRGLEGVIQDRGRDVWGILNGSDREQWNPECDRHIPANYSEADLSGKSICKRALQREMHLPEWDVPIFGVVSRLVHQKGLDVLADVLDEVFTWDVQMVLLGSGERWLEEKFKEFSRRYPQRFACHIGYSDPLAHRIEAGSDFFVMPSRFEPCGLNQIYSLAYGTPPIVHAVGGLDDTVINFDPQNNRGTGFKLYDLTKRSLTDTLGWANDTWHNNKEALKQMRIRGMRERFSWETAAQTYESMYEAAIQKKRRLA